MFGWKPGNVPLSATESDAGKPVINGALRENETIGR